MRNLLITFWGIFEFLKSYYIGQKTFYCQSFRLSSPKLATFVKKMTTEFSENAAVGVPLHPYRLPSFLRLLAFVAPLSSLWYAPTFFHPSAPVPQYGVPPLRFTGHHDPLNIWAHCRLYAKRLMSWRPSMYPDLQRIHQTRALSIDEGKGRTIAVHFECVVEEYHCPIAIIDQFQ